MKKILKILSVFSLTTLFLSGTVYTINDWRILQPYMLIGSTTLILFFNILCRNFELKVNLKLLTIFFLFILFSILSTLLNSDFELFCGALLLIYIYISLAISLPSIIRKYEENGLNVLALSLLMGHIPVVILSVILSGISYKSYAGIFYNPNSFGTVVATIFAVTLSEVMFFLEQYMEGRKFKKKSCFFSLFLSIMMFLLVIVSSSRTSFLSAIILIFLSILFCIKKKKSKNVLRFNSLLVFFIIIGIIVCNFTSFNDILYNGIFSKFQAKQNDLLDGRSYVWAMTIKETTLFGHGRDYFSKYAFGPHNTFISILGQYGLIPLLFFTLFLVKLLIQSIKYTTKKNKYKYLPFFVVISFIVLSMGEGMMLKTSMLLMFSIIGFL